jgi:shikimate dehydrogenase
MNRYVSLSQYPGTQGQYFYTNFFKLYHIDADYTPLCATPETLVSQVQCARDQGVSGISVSMPFKKSIIALLDNATDEVTEYQSCNTVVIQNGKLYGHNADLNAVQDICGRIKYPTISILGNGSIGTMFVQFLSKQNRFEVNVYSPSLGNWGSRHTESDVIINCTALGTIDSTSPLDWLGSAKMIIDLAVKPGQLYKQAESMGIDYISGQYFYKNQFMKQFWLYTGISPNPDDYDKIALAKP